MANENWCEIFRTGTHTAKNGKTKTWTEADLDRVVADYKPGDHEAPICIDHDEKSGPIKGGPAYGWIEALKREGGSLLARFKAVVPTFAKAVNDGFFKKRSAAFFSDGSLRHVAFLGAVPPAVKGMAPFEFQMSGDDDCFCYSEAIGDFKFSEEDRHVEIEELKKKVEEESTGRKAAEGQVATLQKENQALAQQFSEGENRRIRQEIETLVNAGIAEGKMLPAWKDAGIVEFMTDLSKQAETYEFSEGKKQTPLEWFKEFVTGFAAHPLFKAMGKPAQTDGHQFSDDDKCVEMILNAGNSGKEGK